MIAAVGALVGSAALADPLADNEQLVWQVVDKHGASTDYDFYLRFYPNGRFAAEAAQKAKTALPAARLETSPVTAPASVPDPAQWTSDPVAQCSAHDRDHDRDDIVSITWSGGCRDHKFDGRGVALGLTARGRIGRIAIGTYTNGMLTGSAMIIYANGDRREGAFADGRLEGQGIFYYSDGGRQEGEFKNGKLNGRGIYIVAGELRTDGQYENNLIEGHAVTAYANGDRVEGDYTSSLKNGFVKTELADGSRIEATYKLDRLDGHMLRVLKDGSRFEADFKDGYIAGDATFTRPNGEIYKGAYVPPRPDPADTRSLDDLYPQFSAFIGEQGKIKLRVTVNADGSFSDVVVTKSSGFKRLDGAALVAVKARIAYFPATVGGHAITVSGWPIIVVCKLNP